MPSSAGNLLFDWLDPGLVAVGFVALVLLAMAPSEVAGIDLTTMPGRQAACLLVLAPSLVRRALFGSPRATQVPGG